MASVARKLSKVRKAARRVRRFDCRLTSDGTTFGAVAWFGDDGPERDCIALESRRLQAFASRPRGCSERATRRAYARGYWAQDRTGNGLIVAAVLPGDVPVVD